MIIVYFSLYCFLGYLSKSIFLSLAHQKWTSAGLLHGPFMPLYGIGACIIIMTHSFLHFLNPMIIYLLDGCLLLILQWIAYHYIEKYFHKHCWDRSRHHCHYQGKICLFDFFLWCFVAVLFFQNIHQFLITLPLFNDATSLISLIYLFCLLKSYNEQFLFPQKNSLDIH